MYLLIIWLSFNHLISKWLPKMQLGKASCLPVVSRQSGGWSEAQKAVQFEKGRFLPVRWAITSKRSRKKTLMWWRKSIIMMWLMWRKLEFVQKYLPKSMFWYVAPRTLKEVKAPTTILPSGGGAGIFMLDRFFYVG